MTEKESWMSYGTKVRYPSHFTKQERCTYARKIYLLPLLHDNGIVYTKLTQNIRIH